MLIYCASSGKSPDPNPSASTPTSGRYSRSSDRRFRCIQLPWVFDGLSDFLKFKIFPFRHTLGRRRFSTDRLYATGYRHRYGISELHKRALDLLTGTYTIFSQPPLTIYFYHRSA